MNGKNSALTEAICWSDQTECLPHFMRHNNSFPSLVKLTNEGKSSVSVLVRVAQRKKFVAQSKNSTSRKTHYLIPESYCGFFELLSEEGRAARCLEYVSELIKGRSYLVREPIKSIVCSSCEDGIISTQGARLLSAGDIISAQTDFRSNGDSFLQCACSGQTVLLATKQKGKFSVIGSDAGVYTTDKLMKKRLPVTVRLVHGEHPRGLKHKLHFRPELRLQSVLVQDEDILVIQVIKGKPGSVSQLPKLSYPFVKISKIQNISQIENTTEYKNILGACVKAAEQRTNTMSICHSKDEILHSRIQDAAISKDTLPSNYDCKREYNEIDQIYDYVRGLAPIPKNILRELRHGSGTGDDTDVKKEDPNNLYQKNCRSKPHTRLNKQKSVPGATSRASPIFNIRYKSLSNLEVDDFGGCKMEPNNLDLAHKSSEEKRRKSEFNLRRPRSLNNLVWEVEAVSSKPVKPEFPSSATKGTEVRIRIHRHTAGEMRELIKLPA